MLLVGDGRIFGVSGVMGGLIRPVRGEVGWRMATFLGLAVGGFILREWMPETLPTMDIRPLWQLSVAGLLVGFGARLGGGCTSGHGVCGVGRGSKRSIVATMLFMASGMIIATLYELWTRNP
ncbi:membrane protein [Planctomyces bekefii]|uniref:Membrane protein n=1 Tax=Planctomyces bekefii TaxID=1653850 RepID=A0A5C6M3X1_9PLAN|nr:membrane protein [Planctomyces bekefii]